VQVLGRFPLETLARLPGATSRARLEGDATTGGAAEVLRDALSLVHDATARGDHAEAENGFKFVAIMGHLCFPEPHRHLAKNAKKQGKDPRAKRREAQLAAVRRTLALTPAELLAWVTERVARLEPEAERDPPPVDSKEKEVAKLVAKIRRHVAHNELSKAASELPGVTALEEGGDAAVRAGRLLRMDAALRARLQALHPPPAAGQSPAPVLPAGREAYEPGTKAVFEALRSFHRSTGLGPSGFPVQALKSLCTRVGSGDEVVDSECLQALTRFVGDIMAGRLPPAVMAVWASARLLALSKANGKPRPIAVGEIFRRLAAKCAVRYCAKALAERLKPIQRGVGVSGGVEQLAHSVTVMLETHPEWCVLSVDIKNAFNSVLRESILRETLAHLPEVVDLVFGCYGGDTPLLWLSDSDFIESLRGVQQGDPLGPALFALAFHPVLLLVKERHPEVRVMAGHDDVYMLGRPADCVAAFATFSEAAGSLGLSVDASESRVFSMAEGTVVQDSALYAGVAVPVPHTEGVVVFGTPIGHPEWVQRKLRELISAHRASLRALPLLGSAQVSQHLIASSHSARAVHLLRTLPPAVSEAFALAHDDQMWVAFGHVLGLLTAEQTRAALQPLVEDGGWPVRFGHWLQTALGEPLHAVGHGPLASEADWALRQARLRRSDGGCSVGDAHSTREAAFVGSWALAIQEGVLVDFPELGAALAAEPAERSPHVKALAAAWEVVVPWVPVSCLADCPGGPAGHEGHGALGCLLGLCPVEAAVDESGESTGRFSSHLQRRLMKNAQTKALEAMYDDASQAWQREAGEVGRAKARDRWGRLIATSGAYAHASLTALPGDGEDAGHTTMDSRSMQVWMCFRLGIPPPLMRGAVRMRTCALHGHEQSLVDDRGYHWVHCGRATPHIMHSGLEDSFAYVASSVPGLRVKVEAAVFAGRGNRMDVVVVNPLGVDSQQLFLDVTMGTAMGDPGYAGTPRDGFRLEPGWRGVAGSAAVRAEEGKHHKYGALVRAAGAAQFEGACVEDFGAFGKGALTSLDWIAGAAYPGLAEVPARNLFKWKAAQHVGVAVARAVVAAHDENVRRMRDLAPEVLLARFGPGGPSSELLEEARAGLVDPWGPDSWSQAPPRPPSSRRAQRGGNRRPRFVAGGAPFADSRTHTMSSGAFDDNLQRGTTLPGFGGRQPAGPLMVDASGAS